MTQRVHNKRKTWKLIIFITQKLSTKKLFLDFCLDYCDISLRQKENCSRVGAFWLENFQLENSMWISWWTLNHFHTTWCSSYPWCLPGAILFMPMEANFGKLHNCQHFYEWKFYDWNFCYYLWCCSITITWVHCMLCCYYHFTNANYVQIFMLKSDWKFRSRKVAINWTF